MGLSAGPTGASRALVSACDTQPSVQSPARSKFGFGKGRKLAKVSQASTHDQHSAEEEHCGASGKDSSDEWCVRKPRAGLGNSGRD